MPLLTTKACVDTAMMQAKFRLEFEASASTDGPVTISKSLVDHLCIPLMCYGGSLAGACTA